ncbi:MAG: transporter substrate-binding domain-containing protein [Geobacteraceae bacterium]|nr:transporter substrate-binding domain-containing protein [Geobacteraceae bacterium]
MPGNLDTAKRLKWIWIVLGLILLTALASLTLSLPKSSNDPLTVEERSWLNTHPEIRFAPDPDFPPTEFFDEKGRYSGMTADYLALLEKKLGIHLKVIQLRNWDEVISRAKNRQIDIFTAAETPQRSHFALFTSPYLELPAAIIAREKVHDPITMESLKGMKVSVVSGYAVNEYIARQYPEIHLDVVPDVQTGLRKVSFGTSDAFVENLATASYYIEKEGISNLRIAGQAGYIYKMAFASRKDWPLLSSILEKGLAQISAAEKRAIYKKWIPLEQKTIFTSKIFQTAILVTFIAFIILCAGIITWNRVLKKQVTARTWELEKELLERSRVEVELRESEEKFRVLAETLPAGICLYTGEQIVYVNTAAADLLGYTEQECLQMRFWEWVHKDYRAMVRERGLARQRGEKVPSRYECLHTAKNGEERWLFVSAGQIDFKGKPAGLVSFMDITERKRSEEALRTFNEVLEKRVEARTSDLAVVNNDLHQEIAIRKQVEEELRENKDKIQSIVDAFEGLIYICSRDYRIQFMNRSFINRTGCDTLGEFCYTALHGRESVCPTCDIGAVFEGMTVHRETQNPEKGTWDYVVDVPLYHPDGSISRQTMVTDITERKKAEEKLRQKKQQLEDLNRTLEMRVQEEVEKNRNKDILLIHQNRQAALGETLDHIAHQWKQPLNALSLLTGSLQEEALSGKLTNESLNETTATILGLVDHMAQTINVFRDFYRPEKEMTVFFIKEAIDKALSFIKPAFRLDSIEVDFDANPLLAAYGYPKEYAQVLLNILSNAREAFKGKGVGKPKVSIQAVAENGKAIVTVSDNAGGIPDANIDRIFDLYFTTRESYGGTGIGLYMSKNIIEKNMGGILSVRNTEYGAQFRIELVMPATSYQPAR